MDLNVQAFKLVQEATGEDMPGQKAKKLASQEGGRKGGPARAKALTAFRRREIALKANRTRWVKETTTGS